MPDDPHQPISRVLFKALANLLFAFAGLSFLFGGRFLAEIEHTDRLLGEVIGIGLAVLAGALGAAVKSAIDE